MIVILYPTRTQFRVLGSSALGGLGFLNGGIKGIVRR